MKVIYISGPITNNPDYKREFNRVENELQVNGYITLNPAHLPAGMSDEQYMRICLAMIEAADAVVVVGDWMQSRGSRLETDYCLYTGKTVYLSLEALEAHARMEKEVEANAVRNA